jgi:predicted nucleic acid-binding protein
MTFSSSLVNDPRPLVLDTSVLINLHACTYGERILAAIPNGIRVPQIVAGELEHETSRKNGEHNFLRRLINRDKVTVADMTDKEYELFAKLTSGSCSLDDGEAATIAIAAGRNLRPIIDEKKGRCRAATLMAGREPNWSLDLLRHPLVLQNLGDAHAADALYLALRDGRMRIPVKYSGYVVDLSRTPRYRAD